MAFCSKCGKEMEEGSFVCPYCGNDEDKVNVGLMILAVLIPIAGIIMGIVNLSKGKKKSGTAYLVAGIIAWVLGMVITFAVNPSVFKA
ncbi:MAG: hypothetical protein IKO47_12630 [Ruminococcus sp.]|nr:hypothetical protein [Ruminococcus sp.]